MGAVMGVDSSTQSTKVEVRDLSSGRVLASASAPHPPTTPPVSEQQPVAWFEALQAACAALPDELRAEVEAVSVAGQQHGMVLVDADGDVIRPAKLWNDTTSAPQATALVDELGATTWSDGVGSVPVAAFTVAKLRWMRDHEPDALAATARIMLPHDWLTWRLTGEHVTDRGDASGTGWFDAAANEYRPDLLAAGGVTADPDEILPRVLGPTEPAGELTADAAAALGLTAGITVGAGTGDNMAAALGLGIGTGDVVLSLGTSGVAYAASATPTADATGCVAGFADATGRHLPLVCTLNATKVTDTVAAWLGTDAAGLAELALTAEAGPVTVIPWFDGERTPNRPNASGSILGLRTDTTPAQIALAAHDGVLCGLFDGVAALEACGVDTSGRLHLIGGGARSVAYRQRCADLWGRTIAVPRLDESVATGAAVQAAAVVGARGIAEVQADWQLDAADLFEPRDGVDGQEVRERYATATSAEAAMSIELPPGGADEVSPSGA